MYFFARKTIIIVSKYGQWETDLLYNYRFNLATKISIHWQQKLASKRSKQYGTRLYNWVVLISVSWPFSQEAPWRGRELCCKHFLLTSLDFSTYPLRGGLTLKKISKEEGITIDQPFSNFWTGLNSSFISFFLFSSSSFFCFSSLLFSSSFLASALPPCWTWVWTCWIYLWFFAPFLFFSPNVLS